MQNISMTQRNSDFGPQVQSSADGFSEYHADLYRVARRELNRMVRSGTIDTVALVNEAYLKVQDRANSWESRSHFIASMTTTMRHVLVDYAREQSAQRRGGDWLRVTTSAAKGLSEHRDITAVVQMDQAMRDLGQMSERLERIVELKTFAGMTVAEIARTLEVSESTVARELRTASAYLSSTLEYSC